GRSVTAGCVRGSHHDQSRAAGLADAAGRHMDAHARRGVGGLMLKTNLATKPFYNERAVRNGLIAMLLLVVALTAFNAVRAISLRNEEGTLSARATQALADANRLRADARRMTAQIDPREMATVSAAASEANNAID